MIEMVLRDLKDLREAYSAAIACAVEATRYWVGHDDSLGDLARRGRLVKRELPSGGFILQIEKTISFPLDAKGVKVEDRVVTNVTTSDSSEDRYRDTIQASGWKLKNFRKNPVMPVDHSYRVESLTGTWTRMEIVGDGAGKSLQGDALFLPEGVDKMADMTFAKIAHKALRTVSVGFQSTKREERKDDTGSFIGYNFLEQELLEVSWVAVPANANAIIHDLTPDGTLEQEADGSAFDVSALSELETRTRAGVILARLTNRE
jgi:HK97 family phage prohead protease